MISFVVKGCVREYYLNKQTEEVVVWFGLEIERLGRMIAEHYLMNSDAYIKELQTQNAAER